MTVRKVTDFINGWFIGNFEPTMLKTSAFEASIKNYQSGAEENKHLHKVAEEITVVINGVVSFNDIIFKSGDIIHVSAGEIVKFRCLEKATTVVIKIPCVKGDKYEVNSS